MRKLACVFMVMGMLLAALPSAAQDTATPTLEATVEVTESTAEATESTAEATEGTAEVTPESTETGTAEATSETTATVTPGVTVSATAAPVNPPAPSPILVSDQITLNGMVMIDSVTADSQGFVALYATDGNGANAHLVGVAPIPAGTTDNLAIPIDGAMATPFLTAQLHVDNNRVGVFEFGKTEGADAPVTTVDGGRPAAQSFKIAGIFSFDQQPMNNTVVIASVISEIGGWLVIHSEANGQPGPVLGQTLLVPGTNANVKVTLNADGQTPVVWPMLHVDDTTIGTYEFGTVQGADLPIFLGSVTATRPMKLTDAPTTLLADGRPLEATVPPSIADSGQPTDPANNINTGTFVVDQVVSAGPGFVDVHTDEDGHPSASLGSTSVLDGTINGVTVQLAAPVGMSITPIVWPMLHSDTDENGTYEYLMIPGADLPVIYNGGVVTVPAASGVVLPTNVPSITVTPGPIATAVPTTLVPTIAATGTEATAEATEVTAEATESTAEATEATAEATEPTAEATEGTAEVTPDLTTTATLTLTATP
jgi:hypothetical protein